MKFCFTCDVCNQVPQQGSQHSLHLLHQPDHQGVFLSGCNTRPPSRNKSQKEKRGEAAEMSAKRGEEKQNESKKKNVIMCTNVRLTILAVKVSLPRRLNNPRPSDDALRTDADISPSARILCKTRESIITFLTRESL